MDENLDLRSKFQVEGVFWDATKPDEQFPGTLSCDGKDLELVTRAELVRPDLSFLGLDQAPAPDIVHGYTSKGDCTLIGLHELESPGLLDFQSGRGLRWHRLRVTGACLVGWHLASDSVDVLTSADLTYSGIDEWLPGCGALTSTEDSLTVTYPKRPPTVLDVCVLSKRLRVLIKINPNFQFRPGGKRYSSRSEPVITLEPLEPKSLKWFVDTLHRLENLFSLCLGSSVRANAVRLVGQSKETESGWLVRPRGGRSQKPYVPIWVRGDGSLLAIAISAWFSTPEEFVPLENLIYGTIRHSSLFVETEFLSLAQALESFHRITDRSTVVESPVFRQILKSLCQFISKTCGESPLANRLLDGIRHANEPTFQTRVQALLAQIDQERLKKLVGDSAEFERTLRQTRNQFTHPGIHKRANVLTDAKEIFLFNQKLHVLLRLLLLKSIGFPEESVFEQIFQQSRRWS